MEGYLYSTMITAIEGLTGEGALEWPEEMDANIIICFTESYELTSHSPRGDGAPAKRLVTGSPLIQAFPIEMPHLLQSSGHEWEIFVLDVLALAGLEDKVEDMHKKFMADIISVLFNDAVASKKEEFVVKAIVEVVHEFRVEPAVLRRGAFEILTCELKESADALGHEISLETTSSTHVPAALNLKIERHEEGKGGECTICMEEFLDGDEVGVFVCRHAFHPYCVAQWLLCCPSCPLCRFNLMPPHQDSPPQDSPPRDSIFTFSYEQILRVWP